MTIAAVFSALVGLPLTFALDTAQTLTEGRALVLGGVLLAGLLLVPGGCESRSVAYSEKLAERIREIIEARSGVSERKLFGDVSWMVNGNIAVGTLGENLMVRLAHEDAEAALREPFVGPADPTGRRMHDYLTIDAAGIADDAALAGWVDAGADHAASLPVK